MLVTIQTVGNNKHYALLGRMCVAKLREIAAEILSLHKRLMIIDGSCHRRRMPQFPQILWFLSCFHHHYQGSVSLCLVRIAP